MPEGWTECGAGAGIYRRTYDVAQFGETNALALNLGPARWAVLSPPPGDEAAMRGLSRDGEVVALIAPNSAHHAGLQDWRRAFPNAEIFAARAVRDSLKRAVGGEVRPIGELATLDYLRITEAPGVRSGSLFVRSTLGAAAVVYVDELLVTMTERPRNFVSRLLYRLTRTGPGLSLNRLFLLWFAGDAAALLGAAAVLMEGAGVVLVAHGPPIVDPVRITEARLLVSERLAASG